MAFVKPSTVRSRDWIAPPSGASGRPASPANGESADARCAPVSNRGASIRARNFAVGQPFSRRSIVSEPLSAGNRRPPIRNSRAIVGASLVVGPRVTVALLTHAAHEALYYPSHRPSSFLFNPPVVDGRRIHTDPSPGPVNRTPPLRCIGSRGAEAAQRGGGQRREPVPIVSGVRVSRRLRQFRPNGNRILLPGARCAIFIIAAPRRSAVR